MLSLLQIAGTGHWWNDIENLVQKCVTSDTLSTVNNALISLQSKSSF